MTFFESEGSDSSWRHAADVSSSRQGDRRRRATTTGSLISSLISVGLLIVVSVIGPSNVAKQAVQIFTGEAGPPAAELIAVADKSFLTQDGRDLLYASRPRLVASLSEVAEACERSPADPPAGCFSSLRGIFIHQPADARVADLAVTTLAHELLHAAYVELGDGERYRVHDLLDVEIARVAGDDPLHERIAWSVGEHESSRETELFAFLGSEVMPEGGFAPDLEAIYARFFTDRASLVAVNDRMVGVMEGLSTEVTEAYNAAALAEAANAQERGQLDVDKQAHEVARTRYNADADHYNGLPEGERGRWTATWTDSDGTTHTASLGDSLAQRLAELENYRVELDARAQALDAAEAAATVARAEAERRHADFTALARSVTGPNAG